MGNVFIPTDMLIWISTFAILVISALLYYIFMRGDSKSGQQKEVVEEIRNHIHHRRVGGNRNRFRVGVNQRTAEIIEEEDEDNQHQTTSALDADDGKMGSKKRAKLEAKAEKKAQREVEIKIREERKAQREKDDADKKLQEEQERLEAEKLEAEKKRLEEEKRQKEEEEYQAMKAAFTVEEEGFDENDEDEQNLLNNFISYIKEQKVVMLEELAAKFNLRIQTVINRVEDLLNSEVLSGVIDDRGKFIFITIDEYQAVADFVKKRGRVNIQELVENSNSLISLGC